MANTFTKIDKNSAAATFMIEHLWGKYRTYGAGGVNVAEVVGMLNGWREWLGVLERELVESDVYDGLLNNRISAMRSVVNSAESLLDLLTI